MRNRPCKRFETSQNKPEAHAKNKRVYISMSHLRPMIIISNKIIAAPIAIIFNAKKQKFITRSSSGEVDGRTLHSSGTALRASKW